MQLKTCLHVVNTYGMGEALGSAMKCRIVTVDDPVMGNAIGFEAKAASMVARFAKEQSPE